MLHFVPESLPDESAAPYAEAVARLAGIRHALRLVDPFGGGPASDPSEDEQIGRTWADAGRATQRCFDKRTTGTAGAAAGGAGVATGAALSVFAAGAWTGVAAFGRRGSIGEIATISVKISPARIAVTASITSTVSRA